MFLKDSLEMVGLLVVLTVCGVFAWFVLSFASESVAGLEHDPAMIKGLAAAITAVT